MFVPLKSINPSFPDIGQGGVHNYCNFKILLITNE